MKRKLYFFAILMCILGGFNLSNINAQTTVTIGEGGYTNENDKFPVYTWYECSVSQQIYTADDLEQLSVGSVIKSIAFNVTSTGGPEEGRVFSIYMQNTTKDEFSSDSDYVLMDNSNLVYTTPSNIVFNNDTWYTFVLDIPFTYDGDNLLLCVYDYSGNYKSTPSFSLNSTEGKNKAIYGCGYSTEIGNPIEGFSDFVEKGMIAGHNQIQLTFEASSIPQPFSLSASAAKNTIFDNETVQLTARAKGGAGSGYTYSWSPATGLDNATSATPTFTPTAAGTYTFTCTASDGTKTASADVTITVEEAPKIIEIGNYEQNSYELPTNIAYNRSLTQQIYTSAEIGKNENLIIKSIAFKEVYGYAATRNIEIYMRNTTASSCTGTSEKMLASELVYDGSVTFAANDWTTITFTTHFEYNAGQNVLLCVVDKTGSYVNYTYPRFAVYNTNDENSFYKYDDYTSYNVTSSQYYNYSTPQKNCIKLEYEEVAPSAPVLTATATSETSISLTWNAVGGATSYNVYSDETLVTTTTETSISFAGLTTGETYCYTVTAVNEIGESATSNEACATLIIPEVPTNLIILVNGTSITLEWDAVDGATKYRIYDENDNIVETSLNTYTFTGLTEDTRYCYAVSAVSPVGESDKSDYICAKTTEAGGEDEDKEIAGNGSAYSMFLPIYSNAANKYSITQQYYTEEEIDNAGGNITSISFYVYMANYSLTHNLEIYLNNMDEFGFETQYQAPSYQVSSSDLVFEGDVSFPMTEGWVEINLNKQPFIYTGKHILVTVVDNTPSTRYGIAFYARLNATVDGKDCAGYYNYDNMIDPITNSYTMTLPANRNDIRFKFSAAASTIEFINDGDWNDDSNWNTGVVPSATDDVIIKANATIKGDVAVKHLSVEGGSLTIESGSLTVADIMVNNYAKDLIIKDGAQLLQGYDKVKGTFVMNINNPDKWSEWNKTGWQFIASPFTNAAVSQFTSADTYDLYKFDGNHNNITEEWRNHKADANFETKFVSGRGYMASYQNDTTATLSGTFNSSTSITYPVTYQDIQEGETHWPNFHLLGNPFTFNMDLSKLNMTNMATGVAVVNDEGGYDYMETGTINVGDGFFVKSAAASPSVSYGTRGGNNNNVSENISVRVSNSTSRDNVVLNFAGADKVGFPKLNAMNKDIAYLYVVDNNERYGIFNYDKDVKEVPLSFEAQKMGNYTISVDAKGEYETIVLVDRQTGVETNMLLEDYSFTATSSSKENKDRFLVRFTFRSDVNEEAKHFAYQSGDELIIEAEGTVQLFDVTGRMLYIDEVESHGERINVGQLNKAAYILRLVNGEGVKVQKVIIY